MTNKHRIAKLTTLAVMTLPITLYANTPPTNTDTPKSTTPTVSAPKTVPTTTPTVSAQKTVPTTTPTVSAQKTVPTTTPTVSAQTPKPITPPARPMPTRAPSPAVMPSATLIAGKGAQQTVEPKAGEIIYSTHTLTNSNKTSQHFKITLNNSPLTDTLDAAGFILAVDKNDNGTADIGEELPKGTLTLAPSTSATLLIGSIVPKQVTDSNSLHVDVAVGIKNAPILASNQIRITFKEKTENNTYTQWLKSEGGNCHTYTVFNNARAWQAANKQADYQKYQDLRGHLATIESKEENQFIQKLLNEKGIYWLGANIQSKNGFSWIHPIASDYTNWAPTAPTAQAGEALVMNNENGHWQTQSMDDALPYIIEFDSTCPDNNISMNSVTAHDAKCDGEDDKAFSDTKLNELQSGECAIFRVTITNNSANTPSEGVKIAPVLSELYTLKKDSIKLEGKTLTEQKDNDAAAFDKETHTISIQTGTLPPQGSTTAEYTLVVK